MTLGMQMRGSSPLMIFIPGRPQLQFFHERLRRIPDRRIYPGMDQRCVFPCPSSLPPSLNRHPFTQSDLPADFLSTPLGPALRPAMDAMLGRQTGPTIPTTTQPTAPPPASSALIQSVSARATATAPLLDSGCSTPSSSASALGNNPTTTTAIHPSTNPASFRSLLGSHRAVVAMFTSATCAPCRMIESVFEELEWAMRVPRVPFVKVDLVVGMGSMVARGHGVAAALTFGFFIDGKKVRVWLAWFSPFLLKSKFACRFMNKGRECARIAYAGRPSSVSGVPSYVDSWLCNERSSLDD